MNRKLSLNLPLAAGMLGAAERILSARAARRRILAKLIVRAVSPLAHWLHTGAARLAARSSICAAPGA